MIVALKKSVADAEIMQLAATHKAISVIDGDTNLLILPGGLKELPKTLESYVEKFLATDGDIQLASAKWKKEKRTISWGQTTIGGATNNTVIISGPCSVETPEQIDNSAEFVKQCGLKNLRGGCFKPRTSPYSFQGLGKKGLELLAQMREKYGLSVVTEVRDASHVQQVIDVADVVQIGAKSMYDHGILKACGKTQKPVLLKRGFGTTLKEFVQAAEFILSGGNPNVMLCERGIRTFENKTRFTLDLAGAVWLKHNTNLPLVLDPSHAMGLRFGIPDLTKACMALGVDGLLIEVHPTPEKAWSDAPQQMYQSDFTNLLENLKPISDAIGCHIV